MLLLFAVTYTRVLTMEEKNECFFWPNNCVPSYTICSAVPWCYWLGFITLSLAALAVTVMVSLLLALVEEFAREAMVDIRILSRNMVQCCLFTAAFLVLTGYYPNNDYRWTHNVVSLAAFGLMLVMNLIFHKMVSRIGASRSDLVSEDGHELRSILLWIAAVAGVAMPLAMIGIASVTARDDTSSVPTEPSSWETERAEYLFAVVFSISEVIVLGISSFLFCYLMPRALKTENLRPELAV